ncbi:hypothetical protein MNBD_GAMMA25-950 [hydrothermal vent metagenome]|uniref:SnoaL-like domain-containing protein n=1 Tax=hydrothermal vent metagenome TaxID=652676 RepID=A0A3B1BDA0_9ZZZZ
MSKYEAINGSECITGLSDPQDVLIEFYHAFNNQDLEQMENNWLQSGDASMSNPLGGIKRSWSEIKPVYEKIFNGPAEVFVEFYDFSIHQTEGMFCAVGHERGYFKLDETEIKLAIRTSRIYLKTKQQWQQLHHHGSIDQAGLLADYQAIVLQKKV